MKINSVLINAGLLAVVSCALFSLSGCGGSEAKKSSAAELDAFKGNPNAPEAKAGVERMKAEAAANAAKSQASAQTAPAAPASK